MTSATIDGFSHGFVTPAAGFLVAWLGGALGLRCTNRARSSSGIPKAGWLALGAGSIGVGIWTMHFVAMLGFEVVGARVSYDLGLTVGSLGVAVLVVLIGVVLVGYRGTGWANLLPAGTLMGLGIAGMHYMGMAGMHVGMRIHYSVPLVVVSVVIAVVAATAALRAAVSTSGIRASASSSLIFGVAVAAMHYTGMSALGVNADHMSHASGTPATDLIVPMLLGPTVFLVLASAVVMFDPDLMLGDVERRARLRASSGPVSPAAAADTAGPSSVGRPNAAHREGGAFHRR
ncbi:MHYT domain-containing protein [Streptomyces sp. AM 2-1-1]|uniref:MHYT domain-containing protein n=1 Tax=Streptomyces sp. AM 2-1-1 TaxID=3028709 RepID=UPI0023BA3723|nr:MHYT domain-containing protein [Streptomyces sp. AM 2-1-1]WEH38512.1 MHYT domain-containing protein [Streptomyces sp. AM 2-1-1]